METILDVAMGTLLFCTPFIVVAGVIAAFIWIVSNLSYSC
jgi:hypothetical protein